MLSRRRLPDILIMTLLFVLPLIVFWQQTLGGRTLLPTENLYQFEPYATYREVVKAPAIPHNALLSDLVLQNMQWKEFIRQSIAQREIPLWNPHQFAGIPFLAAGQQSTLYPFSLIYYILPLPAAYGWFTVIQLWLAGVFMFAFVRGLYTERFGALLAGIVYQLSAFFLTNAVFPMIMASAVWLPLLLLMVEFIIQRRSALRGRSVTIPWVIIGAVALGCNILAGHVEITYYTLIITAYYAAARLVWSCWWLRKSHSTSKEGKKQRSPAAELLNRGGWLVVMVALGIGLGAVQFIPLFEFAGMNYRDGRSSLEQILAWAHPIRDLVQFVMPNFYGSPSHHSYFDVFTGQTIPATVNALGEPITAIDWGIKNYVEGALYLGILPLALAAYDLIDAWTKRRGRQLSALTIPPYRLIFTLLGLVSLTFMFGLPTYAILYYGLPGINQLHSPFRWIYAVTFSVAVLAGFGANTLSQNLSATTMTRDYANQWTRRLGTVLAGVGLLTLALLLLSRLFYPQIEPLIDRFFQNMAKAPNAFAGARMFYSYQFTNVLIFGLMMLGAGAVFLLAARDAKLGYGTLLRPWHVLALGLTALDLMVASWNFNPASDPALLDFTPPSIQWLSQQPGKWRYTVVDDPSMGDRGKLLNANMTWRYGLDDVRGYESIIPKQYVDFMQGVADQRQLDFNRVAPLYPDQLASVDWSRLALLNVRYIVTSKDLNLYDYLPPNRDSRYGTVLPAPAPVYEDEAVRIWNAPQTLPRAYVAQLLSGESDRPALENSISPGFDVAIEHDTGREKILHANISAVTSWLVLSETYLPGWRAFVRPRAGSDDTERPLEVEPVLDNFIGLNVSRSVVQALYPDAPDSLPEAQRVALDAGQITVRLVYSPASFQLGLFGTFISLALLALLAGFYLWRLYLTPKEQASGAGVIAKNSVIPIVLNLFNRGIDFAFAFIMLRILGPEGAGIYYYAVFIFGWFDILTNFGLNLFLTREVARDHSQAWRLLYNTSILRLILALLGVPLLAGFIAARQATVSPPLPAEAVLAMVLLYIGLLPNSLSTGLSALFYAFEKAEYPAAIATVATVNKAVWGVAALVLGFGVVGLAGVSIITNLLTLGIMLYVGRGLINRTGQSAAVAYRPELPLLRRMAGESWPLMLNHFLQSIFFQVDVIIIEAAHGARMVGQYSVAYKWLSALNVIPAFFTMALLPIMARQAHDDRAALKRNYTLAIKLLVSTALPLAVLFTFMAYVLTTILGGAEYLPDGAIATQLMIWSIPIGWMNSLTQYVLIALDLQRRITWAFVIAVSFNLISNLILIPPYGYRAAALTTIASEAVLWIAFTALLRGGIGAINWPALLWRPVAAAGVMAALLLLGWGIQPVLALFAACIAYPVVLLMLRPFDADERARLTPLLPGRFRAPVPAAGDIKP